MIRNTSKLQALLNQEKHIFRSHELAVLWDISNKNTLLVTISRYLKKGILYSLRKGIYSTMDPIKLHPYEIGCALAGSLAYISGETVLSQAGAIMQQPTVITLFGKKSASFTFGSYSYWCRYLHPTYLIDRTGIEIVNNYAIASPQRAYADLKHINPILYLDNSQAVQPLQEDIYGHSTTTRREA